jgi:hypothetical protein
MMKIISWTVDESEPIPLCVICYGALTNDSMKPFNLKRHFHYKQKIYHYKPVEFYQNRRKGGENEKPLEASYNVEEIRVI